MHDPMVTVFDIRRPWPKLVHWGKRRWYFPSVVTVWHVEPKGHDSGTICKGMRGSGLSWHNLAWAARHVRHLRIHVQPYRAVKRWLRDRCEECGDRFLWRQSRHGYMSTDKVWHEKCMTLRHVRGELDDLTAYVQALADDDARWRVERRLKYLDDKAKADA